MSPPAIFSIPLLAALATPLLAQEADIQPDTVLMERIQAVATRTERATFDVPVPVDVLDGERIDRLQADNVVADRAGRVWSTICGQLHIATSKPAPEYCRPQPVR